MRKLILLLNLFLRGKNLILFCWYGLQQKSYLLGNPNKRQVFMNVRLVIISLLTAISFCCTTDASSFSLRNIIKSTSIAAVSCSRIGDIHFSPEIPFCTSCEVRIRAVSEVFSLFGEETEECENEDSLETSSSLSHAFFSTSKSLSSQVFTQCNGKRSIALYLLHHSWKHFLLRCTC